MTVDHAAADPLVHRALGSPVRTRLLQHLRDEPDLDVAGLGDRLGLHANTVRAHLAVLERAGLVASVAEQRDRPGRPRLRYRATEPGATPAATSPAPPADAPNAPASDQRAYRFLAGILASYLDAVATDTPAAAVEAGEAWGRYVVTRPAPFTEVPAADAIEQVRALMEDFGFAPQVEAADTSTTQLLLYRCPFGDLARQHQDVVCSIHLGLLRGAFDGLGGSVETESLVPWATPQTCVAHLQAAAV